MELLISKKYKKRLSFESLFLLNKAPLYCIKTLAKLIKQKYSRLKKFFICRYIIDNVKLNILITKRIKVE
jgi:hypothetical protein